MTSPATFFKGIRQLLLICGALSLGHGFSFESRATKARRSRMIHPFRLQPSSSPQPTDTTVASTAVSTSALHMVHNLRDADLGELLAGGERYEMVPLPDSMFPTTVFVGNLCEFCSDDDLSRIFQSVSRLQSVPACVARKPNMNSLHYGFVAFPTVEEKENAILRFHGVDFMGRKLRVEEIRDDSRIGRVRVPEKMVAYVLGASKTKTNSSSKRKNTQRPTDTMRRIARLEDAINKKPNLSSSSSTSRMKRMNSNKKKGHRNNGSRRPGQRSSFSFTATTFNLNVSEQRVMERAIRRGYITLEGSATKGYTRRRCTQSRLASAHRQWCDERAIPHIVHCKVSDKNRNSGGDGSSGKPSNSQLLDSIIVDLSPLRVHTDGGGATSDDFDVNDFLVRWKADIATAAAMAGMELRRRDYLQSNFEILSALDDEQSEEEECSVLFDSCEEDEATLQLSSEGSATDTVVCVMEFSDQDSWSNNPISLLPFLSMGIFEGERKRAKAMATELAQLWETAVVGTEDEEEELHELVNTIEDDGSYQSYSKEHESGPALYGTYDNISSRNGPRKGRHRKQENRRRRRRNNSLDSDFYLF